MQKQRCHEFAAQMGWDIVREFSEKGVSGFKVSAKQRDAIQEIQREAALNTFDILLVFMFDRLGRRDDETPFIVEWFVNNGIEVWSAEEGQQRFDNHVDKLLNYIRYWQASGESIKCYNRTQHKENCGGPTTYRAEKVDAVVSKLIRDILQKAGAVSEYDIVQNQIGATASDLQQQIRQAKLELSKKHIEQGRWEGLMLDSLDGKCPFTPEQVKSRLDSVKEAMTSLTASIESLETRLADSDRLTQELKEQHQQLLSWAEMFDTASPAERKLIASHLIKAVTLTRGYGIQIDFNISEAQYLNGMEL